MDIPKKKDWKRHREKDRKVIGTIQCNHRFSCELCSGFALVTVPCFVRKGSHCVVMYAVSFYLNRIFELSTFTFLLRWENQNGDFGKVTKNDNEKRLSQQANRIYPFSCKFWLCAPVTFDFNYNSETSSRFSRYVHIWVTE